MIPESPEAYTTDRESPLAREIANVADAIALAATAYDEIALALHRVADAFEQAWRTEDAAKTWEQ